MKFPFVKRSILEEHKNALVKSETARRRAESDGFELKNELKIAKKIAKDILPRLFKINVDRNIEFETYRVCVDIHRDMVEKSFTHGGSDREIEYIAKLLSEQIERKIVQFNFARCDRL